MDESQRNLTNAACEEDYVSDEGSNSSLFITNVSCFGQNRAANRIVLPRRIQLLWRLVRLRSRVETSVTRKLE
jgi:hypothetical protein